MRFVDLILGSAEVYAPWILALSIGPMAFIPQGSDADRIAACLDAATVTLTASPVSIDLGGSSRLTWAAHLPPGCRGTLSLANRVVAVSGTMTVQPLTSTQYSLTLAVRSVRASLMNVAVAVRIPPTVHIDFNTPDYRALLLVALGISNERIILGNGVDMDLSNVQKVDVASGVHLFGLRTAQVPGARLFTTTRPTPLFQINGDNVRFDSFRLQGPDLDMQGDDDKEEVGIRVGDEHTSATNIDMSNMEVSGWSGVAIQVYDGQGRIDRSHPEVIRIHDNFIHNNQHDGTEGYGVEVKNGATALIEQNVFDSNRHAITGDGRPGTGFYAQRNLVLKHGGIGACHIGICVHIHPFDMHGTDNCLPGSFPFRDNVFNCGAAGEYMKITENAFQYNEQVAFKLRGTPSVMAFVGRNVFVQNDIGDAVAQNESGLVIGQGDQANVLGLDSYGKYGVCDFDGDGNDDLFLATGVSWWYMSGVNRHWVFLRSDTDRFEQLAFGYFSPRVPSVPRRCDVFAVHGNDWVISHGGATDWKILASPGVPFDQLRFGDFNGDGITDVFQRRPDGQWRVVSPGVFDWRLLKSSSLPVDQLRLGMFFGNRSSDVLAVEEGHWSVSRGGTERWAPLNGSMSTGVGSLIIADLDGDGIDDIIHFNAPDELHAVWEVSRNGRTAWQPLASLTWPLSFRPLRPAFKVLTFAGNFDGRPGVDLLAVDPYRPAELYTTATHSFVTYATSMY